MLIADVTRRVHEQHALQEGFVLLHVVTQELGRRRVGDLAVVGEHVAV